ncbi:MAG: hypothetical protein KF857_11840 [Fimbriimonadaceae bacterium]|nr:hypothetical protein [Fimbriimonadaceae bacterium]
MVQARQVLTFGWVLIASAALAQGGPPGPPEGATPAMRKAFSAGPRLRLAGKRTVVFGRSKERLTERILQSGSRLRIESSNGTVTLITGSERSVYDPTKNEIYKTHDPYGLMNYGFLPMSGGPMAGARFKESDGGEVAGRPTRLVVVSGRHGEVFFKSHIDTWKGAILKSEVFGPGGRLIMSFEYSQVKYDVDIPERAFQLKFPGAKTVTVRDEIVKLAAKMGIKPYVLDRDCGLRLENARLFEADGRQVMRQTYAGRRLKVSLFLCKGSVNPEKLTRYGGDRLRSRVWHIGELTLVLVGDAKDSELARLQGQVTEQRE